MITPLNVAFWRAVWTHSNLYLDVTLCKGDLVLANIIAIGAKYLVFFSSRFLKTREKYISFAQLVLLSLYIF